MQFNRSTFQWWRSSCSFWRYDINELDKLKKEEQHFGIIHLNIVSLNKYFDDLSNFLASLTFKYPIIGLSEHIIGTSEPINNTDISGYVFCYNKTKCFHGGTGVFISEKFSFTKCD